MDMLQNGFDFLRDRLHRYASCGAIVKRGGATILETTVVPSRSQTETFDDDGGRLTTYRVDLLFRGDVGYDPRRDDRIVCGAKTYVVLPYGDELWRFDDPQGTSLRVHAQLEEEK